MFSRFHLLKWENVKGCFEFVAFFLSATNYFRLIKKRIGYLLDRGNIRLKINLMFDSILSLFSFYFNVSFDF